MIDTQAPPPFNANFEPPPDPPALDAPSLVQRITTLEDQLQRVFVMMKRDREYMDELRARIGLT